MADLQRYALDDRARSYVLGTLWPGRTLCDAVGALLSGSAGEAYTLAPSGTPIERLYEFQSGGLLPINIERAQPAYRAVHGSIVPLESLFDVEASILRDELIRNTLGVCVFDDVTPLWSELKNPGPHAFNIGEEVYHLAAPDTSIEQIAKLLNLTENIWHRLTVVSPKPLAPPRSRESLARWIESASVVTCTAYDGEGFVVWTRG